MNGEKGHFLHRLVSDLISVTLLRILLLQLLLGSISLQPWDAQKSLEDISRNLAKQHYTLQENP